MEEILSSIRRVIARDETARGGAPLPSPAALALDDVFADEDGAEDVLELTQTSDTDMARKVSADPVDQTTDKAGAQSAELLSPDSAAASRHSLDALAAALAGGRSQGDSQQTADSAFSPDMTMSALVEAALRPMLKQWLDANLPPLVERIVASEIARITGGR